MTKHRIMLSSVEDVKKFTAVINRQPCEAAIVSGRYEVDAKSIMGLFSLDLSKSLMLVIKSDDCGELTEKIEQYIVH